MSEGQVLLGYALVAILPGPNALLVGCTAALHGYRRAMAQCIGCAAGVGTTVVLAALLARSVPDGAGWSDGIRAAGVVLLVLAALHIGRGAAAQVELPRRGGAAEAFRIALLNPVTFAYFVAAFAGPLGGAGMQAAASVAVGGAMISLATGMLVAQAFAQDALRRRVMSRQRAVRMMVAALLLMAALKEAMPLIAVAVKS